MREQPSIEGPIFALGPLLAVWLLFYGLIVVHGLTTSDVQRLDKAWTVEDNAEEAPGVAQAVRASLSLSADRVTH